MRVSELKGKTVITVPGGEKIGTVEDVLLRPEEQRLGALVVKSPRFAGPQILLAEDVTSFDGDAVAAASLSTDKLRDQTRLGASFQMASFGEALKRRVANASGNYLGELTDVHLDTATGKVTGYEVTGGVFARMFGHTHTVEASEHTRLGKDLLIVADEAIPAQSEVEIVSTGADGAANMPQTPWKTN
jgi:uncharacterized protein YrrD